ncbi:lipid-transfer protein [Gordonia paraffinivorans]|uniref:thiolase C-terminal domain-containing protein n=1 Tax=Gordonia paraffinivorans TaxID=175628 RepID=UPI000D6050E4|nr:lipid-transfer protein [Gordonia paraffinivorans]MBY4572530.1 lipid-transfer protein [Gordonia paraffinivorans]PWD41625.1 lipid-transfer protein [Gordonia paraffinivorans]
MGAWAPGACAIVGIGATEFSSNSGRGVLTLAAEASRAALDDAGLMPADIDGIVRCDMDDVSAPALAHVLGVGDIDYWGENGPGGSGPAAMIGQAVAAITAGLATTVLVYRSLNGRSGRRYGLGAGETVAAGGNSTFEEFFAPYGMQTPGQFFAMVARRYAHDHGIDDERLSRGLGGFAVGCRTHANANPAAVFAGRPMTMESYLSSRMLADPLRLFDFCLETDGGSAVVVTTAERARDLRTTPALIAGVAQATGGHVQPGMMYPALMRPNITAWPSRECASKLYARSGIGPDDVDVAQIYDCFTITALLQLEDYGLADHGEAVDRCAAGEFGPGGRLPVNTAGGNLSEGYIHGLNHVLEGVRQIRGTSASQREGARVSLVTSAPPPGASALMLVAS